MKTLLAVVACLLPCLLLSASAPPADPAPAADLIRLLGDDRYERREAASRRLAHREDAIPALQAALRHRDAEVRRRAARLLRGLRGQHQAAAMLKADALLRAGSCDGAIELLLRFAKEPGIKDRLPALCKFAATLIQEEQRSTKKLFCYHYAENPLFANRGSSWIKPTRYTVSHLPILKQSSCHHDQEMMLTPSYSSNTSDFYNAFVLSGGAVHALWFSSGVILANGPVTLTKAAESIIVCDDEVTIKERCCNCLIIARKGIRCGKRDSVNVLISGGKVILARTKEQRLDQRIPERSVLKPNDTKFLGVVRFFDLGRAGLDVTGLKVKAARKGVCFAGKVRPGDTITAVDGTRVADAEDLRKRLRPHFAAGTPFTLTLTRGKQALRVTVTPP